MCTSLKQLNKKIITCSKCSRLVNFRQKIAIKKRKQYQHEVYWGKPITGYGDPKAQLLMIGLAPAAHGGNTCVGKTTVNETCNSQDCHRNETFV